MKSIGFPGNKLNNRTGGGQLFAQPTQVNICKHTPTDMIHFVGYKIYLIEE